MTGASAVYSMPLTSAGMVPSRHLCFSPLDCPFPLLGLTPQQYHSTGHS